MSEEPSPAEQPGAAQPETTSGPRNELSQLWIRSAGWLVMCIGAMEIIGALHFHHAGEVGLLELLGFVLMGAAAILAGQALSEGYAWGLPLCAMMFGIGLGTAVIGFFIYKMSKPAIDRGLLRTDLSSNAKTAYAIWLGGFSCMLLALIFSYP